MPVRVEMHRVEKKILRRSGAQDISKVQYRISFSLAPCLKRLNESIRLLPVLQVLTQIHCVGQKHDGEPAAGFSSIGSETRQDSARDLERFRHLPRWREDRLGRQARLNVRFGSVLVCGAYARTSKEPCSAGVQVARTVEPTLRSFDDGSRIHG